MTFILGVILGGLSGVATYGITHNGHLGLIAGGIAAVLTWVGAATLLLLDD
ncbi:hypothetical protein [Embleya sp. NPDC005971]|uniref:hypothetical protein n=1 Tax=Embleya sp. NPDC005971 TaxID=3156724 RepID=UPI0033F13D73